MLKQFVGFSRYRHVLTAALLGALAACDPAGNVSSGYVQILPARSEDIACDARVPGHLQLDGLVDARVTVVSSEELCQGTFVWRELPAGLYSVTWQPDSSTDREESAEQWTLRGPSVMSILPRQVTRLRVRQETPDHALAANVP
jgi:hypothetical protein